MERVVITGAAGTIGRLLAPGLEGAYDVRKLDRRWRSGPFLQRQDLRRAGFAEAAFAGADTVIDLAADSNERTSWDSVRKLNIPTTMATFEAARSAGVRRVIYASSGHVMGLYERDEPYASICAGRYEGLAPAEIPLLTSSLPVRPDGAYAIGKAAGEAAARHYADAFGLSVICLRIGVVYANDRPGSYRGRAIMLTHADLLRLIHCCLTAPPDVGFAILYGVSANTWRFWDIDEARQLIGYVPVDDAEQWPLPTQAATTIESAARQ